METNKKVLKNHTASASEKKLKTSNEYDIKKPLGNSDEYSLLHPSSRVQSLSSAFAELANAFIDYDKLKIKNNYWEQKEVKAKIEVEQDVNALRQKLLEDIDGPLFKATKRNVKVSSASVQDELEFAGKQLDSQAGSVRNASEYSALGYQIRAYKNSADYYLKLANSGIKFFNYFAKGLLNGQ